MIMKTIIILTMINQCNEYDQTYLVIWIIKFFIIVKLSLLLYVDDDDDDQNDDHFEDDGASLSDDLPQHKVYPKDESKGK